MSRFQRELRRPLLFLWRTNFPNNQTLRNPALVRPSYVKGSVLPTRFLHSSSPCNGVTDSLRGAYNSAFSGAEEKREQKIFEVQMSFLTDKERPMDGDVFLDLLAGMKSASGMGGVKEHLPWVQNNPALQEFKNQELIICSMTPAERRDLSLVRIAAKKRIAASSQLALSAVEGTLSQLESMCQIQKWICKRSSAGLPLPKNPAELQNMVSAPGAGIKGRRSHSRRMPNPGLGKIRRKK